MYCKYLLVLILAGNLVLLDIYDFFEKNINKNFGNKKIVLDPGIGFGKNLKHNLTLISKISLFHSLGFPILIGTCSN